MVYEMNHIWTADMKSSKDMIYQFLQLRREAVVWTRDLAIPVRRSNQTPLKSWIFSGFSTQL